jgi:hypothetical protein
MGEDLKTRKVINRTITSNTQAMDEAKPIFKYINALRYKYKL